MDQFRLHIKLISGGLWNSLATYKHERLLRCIEKRRNAEAIPIIEHQVRPFDLFGYKRQTLLHYAVECDNSVIAQHLIDKGWDLGAADANGEIALTVALRRGSADSISVLLDAVKCDFSVRDYMRRATLTLPKDLCMVKLLVEKLTSGCHENGDVARTLLKCQCPLPLAVCTLKNAELTKLMLDGGCPVDDRLASTGETALHLAVEYSDIDNVKLLVERGAEIEAKDKNDCTPLSRFKMSPSDPDEKLDVLEFLLDNDAALSAVCRRSRFGVSTIQSKLFSQKDDRVLRLASAYVSLFRRDATGREALDYLKKNKTVIRNSRGKCPIVGTRWGSPWSGVLNEECDWYSNTIGFVVNPREKPIKIPQNVYRYLGRRFLESDKSELHELKRITKVVQTYHEDARKMYGKLNRYVNYLYYDPSMTHFFELVNFILAELALAESRGMALSELVLEEIEDCENFRVKFRSSKEQISKMKETTFYESTTLYELLVERITSLIACARNTEFQRNYELKKSDIHDVCSIYANVLIARVEKAIVYANAENAAACVLCRITELPVIVVYSIVEYLDLKDLQSMSRA